MIGLGLGLSLSGRPAAAATGPAALVVVDNSAGKVSITDLGGGVSRVTKTDPGGSYDSSAIGTDALTGDFIIRLTPQTNNKWMVVGLGANPSATNDNASINYGMYFDGGGTATSWAGGNYGSEFGPVAYAIGDNWFIKRTGSTIVIGSGGTDGVTGFTQRASYTTSATLYLDSSMADPGGIFDVVRLA